MLLTQSDRTGIILGVLCGSFLAALDTTILATVMPTIVMDLGGLSLYSWVFAVYMIMTAVSMPLWGKMSDMFGRRNLFVASVVLFLSGSVLCGVSQSMVQLILFRGLQGIGAGGLSAVPFALISTVFAPHERGKAIGLISSVWGISSVLGPLLGSFITVNMNWRWVFFVNIPVGVLAVFLVVRHYAEVLQFHKERIDYAGGVLLAVSIIALLLASMNAGKTESGVSSGSVVYMAVFIAATLMFVLHERKAVNPILHIEFFTRRQFWLGNVIGFLSSFVMYAVIAYMPLFSQSAQGGTAMQAGLIITPMSLGWSLSAVVAGRFSHRIGEVALIRIGIGVMFAGFLLTTFMQAESPSWFLIVCVTVCGIGMGAQTPPLLLIVQSSLEPKNLGVATSSQMLSRTIGGAVGVSILGAVLSASMARGFSGVENMVAGGSVADHVKAHLAEPQELLGPALRSRMSADELAFVLGTFTEAIHTVFVTGLAVIVVSFLLTFLLPGVPAPRSSSLAAEGEAA